MVSKKKVAIAVVVVIVVVAVVAGVFFFQSFMASFTEPENTMRSFIIALKSYDANSSWALMSSDLQDSYGTKADFNSSILDGLKQSYWQASLTSINTRSMTTSNDVTTAHFVVVLQITETGMDARDEDYTFDLVKTGDQWKVDDWRIGIWD